MPFVLLTMTVASIAQPRAERAPPLDGSIWPQLVTALEANAPPQARSTASGVGQNLAFVGREDLIVYDIPQVPPRKVCNALMRDDNPVDPVAYIAEASRASRVVMINEAHAEPLTRHFISTVSDALRPLGYAAYAAETFAPSVGQNDVAVPLLSDGYYSREPIYGRLVRHLRELNYRLLPYEADVSAIVSKYPPTEVPKQRMIEQAENLLSLVQRASSKVLVHAGQGNLSEYSGPDRAKAMGANFAEMSGINPLTVEITTKASPGDKPVVCDPAAFAGEAHRYDIFIGLPKLAFENHRPRWRLEAGDFYAEIPEKLMRPKQFAIYEARPLGEYTNTTPTDRLLLRPGERLPLLLPPGTYSVSVWTEREGWSSAISLSVVR